MPDGMLVLLVELRGDPPGYWLALGPGGRRLFIDGRRMEIVSELVSA